MNETILIIGDSPFLGTLEGQLQYALDKYESIGINHAILKYSVTNHVFQDMPFINLTNQYPHIKTISLNIYGDLIQKENKELFDSYTFDFHRDTADDLYRNNKLAWTGFTHDYAISYCIHKGYKNIILIGAADFSGNTHYIKGDVFNFSEKLKRESKKFIEQVCSKRANIYTCNPESFLEIPRITLPEVMNF
jgi:hypothetical protein